ncbi:RrF2 family transcriptional regulator [Rhodalgimonas zhirmunskyi]|uniref:Rrf2 family transcriptional regulator n=1 Tax=Rhodalgimonas zhirmunskyi TaxID=2964767 RepID=A0AAJ1X6N8_9RHOB|nr:Rrf2 family transcriptional regulator [Rhodoalgimonas zhirmunskyi]MDQ2093667.1 Rrf2 family transcriptional regulator [Rhodoalgimonas zhirmunskyi]
MRVTKRTNIAIRVLMFCEVNRGRLVTKSEIAQCCNTSENHLAQVINQLGQLGYLHTQRGRNGGIELKKPAGDVVIGDIFRALESHVPLTECFADVDNTCPLIDACRLRMAIQDAAEAFYAHLDGVTLDALCCDNDPLYAIMGSGGGCGVRPKVTV